MQSDEQLEHLKPKGLYDIWANVLPKMQRQYPNLYFCVSGFVLGLVPVFFGVIENFRERLLPVVDFLSAAYLTLIGFVLTGFAIFASTDNQFLAALNLRKTDEIFRKKLTLLNLHLMNFVKLLVYIGISTIVVLLISVFGHILPSEFEERGSVFRGIFQSLVLSLVGLSITTVGVQVKSLIFNLYDLTFLRVRFFELFSKKAVKKKLKK